MHDLTPVLDARPPWHCNPFYTATEQASQATDKRTIIVFAHPEALLDGEATGPLLASRPFWNAHLRALYAVAVLGGATADPWAQADVVRAIWMPLATLRCCVSPVAEPEPPALDEPTPLTIGEVLADLREKIDLPAADLAALCGVGRRQFYNLLTDKTTTTLDREQLIRELHRQILLIDNFAGGDRTRVRAALLLPLGPAGETLYTAARDQDLAAVTRLAGELIERLRDGRVKGMIARPSPSLSGRSDGSRAAASLRRRSSEAEIERTSEADPDR